MRSAFIQKQREPSRSIGFPKSDPAMGAASMVHGRTSVVNAANSAAAAKPNRSHKGGWFVTLVIVSLLGFTCISVWNEFFRFQAYGQLEGTIVTLSTAVKGTVKTVHFREGELVAAGQLLVELDVPELEFQRQQINRQFQLAVSDLQVRLAELDTQDRQLQADERDRVSRYYQLLSQFHQNESQLEKLRNDFDTSTRLLRGNAIAKSEFVDNKTAYEGQKYQQQDLAIAIRALEPLSDSKSDNSETSQLLNAEMELVREFQAELNRVEELLQAKQIRAPVAGRVLKRLSEPGEHLSSNSPVLELVESASVEAVVYLPQRRASVLAVGDIVELVVAPLGKRQCFRVDRFAPEVVTPPPAIQANYRAFKGLVRVHATPVDGVGESTTSTDLTMWVGAELSLPSFGFRNRNTGYSQIVDASDGPNTAISTGSVSEDSQQNQLSMKSGDNGT